MGPGYINIVLLLMPTLPRPVRRPLLCMDRLAASLLGPLLNCIFPEIASPIAVGMSMSPIRATTACSTILLAPPPRLAPMARLGVSPPPPPTTAASVLTAWITPLISFSTAATISISSIPATIACSTILLAPPPRLASMARMAAFPPPWSTIQEAPPASSVPPA